MTASRSQIIDFLRGLVIIDMMLVHYSYYIDIFPGMYVAKIINYSDIAIEGFLLLFGYMIGSRYYSIFISDKKTVINKIFRRVLEIIKIQYLMIITISIPLAIIVGKEVTKGESVEAYITKSFLLLNQVDLLHILPTFIPLLLLSIPVLYLMEKKYVSIVIMISVSLFVIGNIEPYLVTIGEKARFPIILWQIYYVMGLLLGIKACQSIKTIKTNIFMHILFAIIIFISTALIYHGHHLFSELSAFKSNYHISVSKYPLNYLGYLYHGSILYILYCMTVLTWKYIKRYQIIINPITLFGRHSMLAFVIHVYFAYTLIITNYYMDNYLPLSIAVFIINMAATFMALSILEKKKMKEPIVIHEYRRQRSTFQYRQKLK